MDGAPGSRGFRLAPGTVLAGTHRIVRWIGHGSMGEVYEAASVSEGKRVALKVLHHRLRVDPAAHRRFEREADLGMRIRSGGVVHTLESGYDAQRDAYFTVMEYVEGQPLHEWREGAGVGVSAIQGVIEQLLRAVAAAHAAGVVHRDLKPGNVLVVEGGWDDPLARGAPLVKVLDFGVAKWLHSTSALHTREGLGTPSWTAPEQGQAGHRPALNADVWSLGLMVFWLLTGRQYWLAAGEGGSLADLALELVRRPIVLASERAEVLGVSNLLPAGFDPWFARCVCREPEQRYAHAGDALDALGRILDLHTRQPRWWSFWRRGQRRRAGDR